MKKILSVADKKENEFLRRKSLPIELSKEKRRELRELVKSMRVKMKEAIGIGLAANQIGRSERLFVAELDKKFYAVLNPKIIKNYGEKVKAEEGCLSVPGKYGLVERSEKVVLEGYNIQGKKIKIKAWGLLARVFQHEVDHLDGKVFIDRTKEVFSTENREY